MNEWSEWDDVPRCPRCGRRDDTWWDGTDLKFNGDTAEFHCDDCEIDYDVNMSISPDFRCRLKENSDDK